MKSNKITKGRYCIGLLKVLGVLAQNVYVISAVRLSGLVDSIRRRWTQWRRPTPITHFHVRRTPVATWSGSTTPTFSKLSPIYLMEYSNESYKEKGGDKMSMDYMPNDMVRVKSVSRSKIRLGGSLSRMESYIGHKGYVLKVYPNNVISINGIPYALLGSDLELIERPDKPEWVAKLYTILEGRNNSHKLNYVLYNKEKYPDQPPSKHTGRWVTNGYCFQSFSSSLSGHLSADRLRWEFYLRPSTNFQFQKDRKSVPNWWLTNWWRMGAFPKDVKLKDLKAGILDMPIRQYDLAVKGYRLLPTNRVYYAVGIVRHIWEWYDGIVATKYLVEKEGMEWWTALSCVATNPQASRGHSLWGTYVMPNAKYKKEHERIALHAVMHQRWFDYARHRDVTQTIFKFWSTVKEMTGSNSPEVGRALLSECNEHVHNLYDLTKFNPKEVKKYVEISQGKRRIQT